MIFFSLQPYAFFFDTERRFIRERLQNHNGTLKDRVGAQLLRLLYWPIFISKGICLTLLILTCAAYFGVKYLHE